MIAKIEKEKMVMNPKVMEVWLNDTLFDAEQDKNITCTMLKTDKKPPLTRYKLDRMNLSAYGLHQDAIDRIYRSLFIHSVGYNELIKENTCHVIDRVSLVANIWRVYAILLEYSCKTDYKTLMADLANNHQVAMARIEGIVERNNNLFLEKEEKMLSKLSLLSKNNDMLEKNST